MPRWPLPELAPTSNENPMNPKLKLLLLMVPLWLSACGDADKPAMPAPQAEVGRAQEHEGEHEETNGHIALTPEQIKTRDRKSTRSELQSLMRISYAVFCLKKKKTNTLTLTHSHKRESVHIKTVTRLRTDITTQHQLTTK